MQKPRVINRELTHMYIITDLVVRTLEVDLEKIAALKTHTLLNKLYGEALGKAKQQFKDVTAQMKREGLRILDIKKEELYTTYTVTQFGITNEIKYISYALRNHTMEEIERLIRTQ